MSVYFPHNSLFQRSVELEGLWRSVLVLKGDFVLMLNVFLWILLCCAHVCFCSSTRPYILPLLSFLAKDSHVLVNFNSAQSPTRRFLKNGCSRSKIK